MEIMKTEILITLLLLIVVVLHIYRSSKSNYTSETDSADSANSAKSTETMAPLNFGTYENNYPRGEYNKGSFKHSECSVGNCPLGTTITDERYCGIQCAQDPDPVSRKECYDYCMNMMKDCH
jgi:hypothetical protein